MNVAGINFSSPLNETIQRVEKWETHDVEQLLREIAAVLMRRKLQTLPSRESELLLQINQPALSSELAKRYDDIYKKLQLETISEVEHAELLELSAKQEKNNIQRLRCLVELAQIRNISLDRLMSQLGIETVAGHD